MMQKGRTLIFAIIALPIVIVARIFRPLIVIRFGPILSKRIGHFTGDVEMYIYEREAGIRGFGTLDIFYHLQPICNHQLNKMLKRTRKLHICPFSDFMYTLDRINHFLPYSKEHTISMTTYDLHGLRPRKKPYIVFTSEEENFGRQALQRIGIPDTAPFACFHVRDEAYLNTLYPQFDWHYHDYRNSELSNYIPAAEELVKRGYFIVRMGAIVKKVLPTNNPKIIDYALNGRTDFLDVYLGAKCQFFISDDSGIIGVPMAFKRPLVMVNFIHFELVLSGGSLDLFIPKKFWSRREHRFLTIQEILAGGFGGLSRGEEFEQRGIDLIENTPEEITAVAMEMDGRLKGTWQTTREDEDLQERFWSFFKEEIRPAKKVLRIGAEFLRNNRDFVNVREGIYENV